jgi:hypothetical protein
MRIFSQMVTDRVKMSCGCWKSRRHARFLAWLLKKRWYWLFDWAHGPIVLTDTDSYTGE